MKPRAYRFTTAAPLLAALVLTSCFAWDDDDADTPSVGPEVGITLSASVSATPGITRADGSIINLHETSLRPSIPHIYYRADADGNVDTAGVKATFYAGIFGCYTGPNKWSELVNSTDAATLNDYYTANLFFNQQASIGAPNARGINALTYSPLRFWPNNKLINPSGDAADTDKHEYVTLWAYYPYNPTSSMGEYGITMTEQEVGKGQGMGRVRFTMNPDASQQVDFMMSAPVVDCNKDRYPIVIDTLATDTLNRYSSKPVPFKFYHMLAQVRIYASIYGTDRMVYQQDENGNDIKADENWFDKWEENDSIKDAYGNKYTKIKVGEEDGVPIYKVEQTTKKKAFGAEEAPDLTKEEFLALGLKVPDEEKCQRWTREDVWDATHTRRRAKLRYQLSLNNIKTSVEFSPEYDTEGNFIAMEHSEATTLGMTTINRYIMNPYWFNYTPGGSPILNDDYMFDYFENVANKPKDDPLGYLEGQSDLHCMELADVYKPELHYNFSPGNILMVVPQKLEDDNVPHIILTAIDDGEGKEYSAKVTINLLKMNINWESGYIYCYAFHDDLAPGDDKVQGPESITVVVDRDKSTDQW